MDRYVQNFADYKLARAWAHFARPTVKIRHDRISSSMTDQIISNTAAAVPGRSLLRTFMTQEPNRGLPPASIPWLSLLRRRV